MHLPVRTVRSASRPKRRHRGQALVLACLSFLLLALMTTLSFNLSHALREKMSLQQHSDALAYSMGVVEARALNYYAASNRAIASAYVGMTSAHGYMAAASATGDMMRAGMMSFFIVAALEVAQCPPYNFQHCFDALEAVMIAMDYSSKASDYDSKVKDVEEKFNKVIQDLNKMANDIHESQKSAHSKARNAVRSGQSANLSDLTDWNVPGANALDSSVGGLNAEEFDCAVDGMNCSRAGSSNKARAQVMTEIANASRPGWAANRSLPVIMNGLPTYFKSDFIKDLLKDIPQEGTHMVVGHQGTAKVAQTKSNIHGPGQVTGNEGKVVVADEHGTLISQWRHGFGVGTYKALVESSENGGSHEPSGAHSGQHDEFKGINTKDLMSCSSTGNCFMKFRADDNPDTDWGQPHVYSYVTKQFFVGDPKKAPWELNDSGSFTLTHGAQGDGKLQLAPGEGAALSKALVYYHRLGPNGWKEAPGLFNPYWRVKLHPFTAQEASKVLNRAGNGDAADLAGAKDLAL
ncbi:hypothetical protein D7W79_37260 [Corallococcus exercitus]|uniref:Uncharacterized protein n=1 Tax=Corallococcus exercitus TaxID=2316736 RepID=A0A3A8HE42_9BACT|nr:hypothetical protein [Corallococcus exercitus]NOK39247.1 hypothetical protein [Corallococcus exercitus]RKG65874.1 hypothetical protein D7W79_37260 [Corallococcus exercitus]